MNPSDKNNLLRSSECGRAPRKAADPRDGNTPNSENPRQTSGDSSESNGHSIATPGAPVDKTLPHHLSGGGGGTSGVSRANPFSKSCMAIMDQIHHAKTEAELGAIANSWRLGGVRFSADEGLRIVTEYSVRLEELRRTSRELAEVEYTHINHDHIKCEDRDVVVTLALITIAFVLTAIVLAIFY